MSILTATVNDEGPLGLSGMPYPPDLSETPGVREFGWSVNPEEHDHDHDNDTPG